MFDGLDENQFAELVRQAVRPDGVPQAETEREILLKPLEASQGIRRAAVLAPLVRVDGGWRLLFIRRSEEVLDHKGQVAFPGGSWEEEDGSDEQTALRETWEEIGVAARDVRVLGKMRTFLTGTGYRITPVVGILPWPYTFTLSLSEVASVFTIPLNWLADPANHEERPFERDGQRVQVIYYSLYQGELLWGATARMTHTLVDRLTRFA